MSNKTNAQTKNETNPKTPTTIDITTLAQVTGAGYGRHYGWSKTGR